MLFSKGCISLPTRPMKPCRHPGCPNLTNNTYCDIHIELYTRPSAKERGYNSKWRRRSKLFLKAYPLCAECLKHNKLTPSTVVDHIIPHRGDPVLMWDETTNWQALCESCHNKKTRKYDNVPEYKYKF